MLNKMTHMPCKQCRWFLCFCCIFFYIESYSKKYLKTSSPTLTFYADFHLMKMFTVRIAYFYLRIASNVKVIVEFVQFIFNLTCYIYFYIPYYYTCYVVYPCLCLGEFLNHRFASIYLKFKKTKTQQCVLCDESGFVRLLFW